MIFGVSCTHCRTCFAFFCTVVGGRKHASTDRSADARKAFCTESCASDDVCPTRRRRRKAEGGRRGARRKTLCRTPRPRVVPRPIRPAKMQHMLPQCDARNRVLLPPVQDHAPRALPPTAAHEHSQPANVPYLMRKVLGLFPGRDRQRPRAP